MESSEKLKPDARMIAEFRLMVLGDVFLLPPEPKTRLRRLKMIAGKPWLYPDGSVRPVPVRTLQRWLKRTEGAPDRIAALMPIERKDKGKIPSVRDSHRELLRKYWSERPENLWSNHYRNLVAESPQPHPSFTSVKRFLRSENLYRVIVEDDDKKEKREKCSFEAAFVNQIWHLDFHHGSLPIIDETGNWRDAKLVAYLDDKSRFGCHAQWYLHECCRRLCAAFEQSALKCGLPYAVYTDNGPAMKGSEFAEGLRRLGVQLRFTQTESPYQNGKLERFWGTMERQLLQMVPKDRPLTLSELNRYTQAWLLKDYHVAKHSELKATPEQVYLDSPHVPFRRIELPDLRSAFRRSVSRLTRSGDGTVQIDGVRFQLPSAHRHLRKVVIRYARWDLSVAELVDPRTRNTVAEIFPLDKVGNSHGKRAKCHEPQRPPLSRKLPGIGPHLEKLCRELDAETGIVNFNPTIPIEEDLD